MRVGRIRVCVSTWVTCLSLLCELKDPTLQAQDVAQLPMKRLEGQHEKALRHFLRDDGKCCGGGRGWWILLGDRHALRPYCVM